MLGRETASYLSICQNCCFSVHTKFENHWFGLIRGPIYKLLESNTQIKQQLINSVDLKSVINIVIETTTHNVKNVYLFDSEKLSKAIVKLNEVKMSLLGYILRKINLYLLS